MNDLQKGIVWIVFAIGAVVALKTGNALLLPAVLAVCIGVAAALTHKRQKEK